MDYRLFNEGLSFVQKQVVAVYWRDIHIEEGWVEDNHDEDVPVFVSYGVLIRRGDPVVIAGTVSPEAKDKKYADRSKFPKGCVVKIEKIGEVKLK